MKREFSINVVILLLINFIIKPFYIFFVETGVQNLSGPEEYGMYFVLLDFVFLFTVINDAGIQNYNSRYLAQNRDRIGDYFGELLGFKLFAGTLFGIIVFIAAWWFDYLDDYMVLLSLIVSVFFINSVFILLRSSLSAMGYYRWDSYISALDKTILLMVLGVLVWNGYQGRGFELIWYPQMQLLAGLLACAVAVLLLRKTELKWSIRFDPKGFGKMLKLTFPYALILLLSAVFNRVDAVMLEQMLVDGSYQAGLYAAGFRFLEAGNMIGVLFATLMLPMFANLLSTEEDVKPLFHFAFKILFLLGLYATLISCFYHAELYELLYDKEYANSSDLLSLLMMSFIPITLGHCFGSYWLAAGRLKYINGLFFVALVINVIGNYWCIPEYGAKGAASITLITQGFLFFGFFLVTLFLDKELSVLDLFSKSILVGVMTFGVLWGFEYIQVNWIVEVVLVGVLLSFIVLAVRWVDISRVKNLMK